MKRCLACNKQIPSDALRCSHCGQAQDSPIINKEGATQRGDSKEDVENKKTPAFLDDVSIESIPDYPTKPLRGGRRGRLKSLLSGESEEIDLDALRREGLLPAESEFSQGPDKKIDPAMQEEQAEDANQEVRETALPEWLRNAEFNQAGEQSQSDDGISQAELDASMGEIPEWVRALQEKMSNRDDFPLADKLDIEIPETQIPSREPTGVPPEQKHAVPSVPIDEPESGIIDAVSSYVSGLKIPRKIPADENHRLIRNVWGVIGLAIFSLAAALLWSGTTVTAISQPASLEMAALNSFIETMSPDSVALVGVDYDLPLAGEMENVAMPVMVHLMTKQVNLVLLSTRPSGPAMSNHLIQQGITWKPDYQIGKVFVLSFLPGNATGLLHFAISPREAAPFGANGADLWHTPELNEIQQLSDFTMVVLLTDSSETGRDWLEQIQPRLGQTPLFVIASSQSGPVLSPYMKSGQIQAMVTGITSGASYERIQLLTVNNQLILRAYYGVLLFMAVLFACVLLISIIPQSLLSRLSKRSR